MTMDKITDIAKGTELYIICIPNNRTSSIMKFKYTGKGNCFEIQQT